MKHSWTVWTAHLCFFALLTGAFWWTARKLPGLPDYQLAVLLAAMTGLAVNHFRWWRLTKSVAKEMREKFDRIMLGSYLVMLLMSSLLDVAV